MRLKNKGLFFLKSTLIWINIKKFSIILLLIIVLGIIGPLYKICSNYELRMKTLKWLFLIVFFFIVSLLCFLANGFENRGEISQLQFYSFVCKSASSLIGLSITYQVSKKKLVLFFVTLAIWAFAAGMFFELFALQSQIGNH
jgi:hypothetical protein